jgi:U3 small nucleolar RNA-associated protein 11
MSSLRKAAPRRTHKERSQLTSRSSLGLLEKKKDYKQRANDYNKKQNILKKLKVKASTRNPDEFYYGMIKRNTKQGLVKNTVEFDHEMQLLMKTQDLKYVENARQVNMKKIEKLKSCGFIVNSDKVNHLIFTEDENFDICKHFDTVPELMKQRENRIKKDALESINVGSVDEDQIEEMVKEREKKVLELDKRLKNQEKLEKAAIEMQKQKFLMGKGAKMKIKRQDGSEFYKWKPRRQK